MEVNKVLAFVVAITMVGMVGCSALDNGGENTNDEAYTSRCTEEYGLEMEEAEFKGVKYKVPSDWDMQKEEKSCFYYPLGIDGTNEALLMAGYDTIDGGITQRNVEDVMYFYTKGVSDTVDVTNFSEDKYDEWGDDAVRLTYDLKSGENKYKITQYSAPIIHGGIFSLFFYGDDYSDVYDDIIDSVEFPVFDESSVSTEQESAIGIGMAKDYIKAVCLLCLVFGLAIFFFFCLRM